MKNVAVVIQRAPDGERNTEALRMSVGLTLADNRVNVVFLEEGVRTLTPDKSSAALVRKHLETLKTLGHRLVADGQALESKAAGTEFDVEALNEPEIHSLLEACDTVISW